MLLSAEAFEEGRGQKIRAGEVTAQFHVETSRRVSPSRQVLLKGFYLWSWIRKAESDLPPPQAMGSAASV